MININPYLEKLPLLREHIYLKFVLFFQELTNKELVREADLLALTLENSALEKLQDAPQTTIYVRTSTDQKNLVIDATDYSNVLEVQETANLSSYLQALGVKRIKLESLLERGQIASAFRLLFHIGNRLTKKPSPTTAKRAYNAETLTALLTSGDGLNEFCAKIRLDQTHGVMEIEYSYCELFYTFTINNILTNYTKTKNHQAIFALAPKLGIFGGLLFLLHHLFWAAPSTIGLSAAILGALAIGAGIGYLTSTIASILYDQEHRDKLLKENIKEITALSHFPVYNPNPILKVDLKGEVLFANLAAKKQARAAGFTVEEISRILPENYIALTEECISSQKEIVGIESARSNRIIQYDMSQFPREKAVMFSGTDITRLKELELELRQFNKHLEEKVIARTEELQKTRDITILSLSSLAETRDPETGAHIMRTQLYVKILAEYLSANSRFQNELGDQNFIDLLFRSAPLHDIGKVGIPDAILLKPGQLTESEFQQMKKHPTIGGDSLAWASQKLGASSFLETASEIAYGHHEKWDGSGYPLGLAGDAIPVSCRLMALADVYDALVSKRVYKEAYSHEKAKTIILKKKNLHFDPDVTDAFMALEDQFVKISATYKDHE